MVIIRERIYVYRVVLICLVNNNNISFVFLQPLDDLKKDGLGSKSTKNEIYEGEWKDGKYDGFGILTSIDNSAKYEGGWKEGKLSKTIFRIISNHYFYYSIYNSSSSPLSDLTLSLSLGKQNGKGRKTWSSGDYYDGQWEEGFKSGMYIIILSSYLLIILSYIPIIILSFYHIIILSYYHYIIILSYYHIYIYLPTHSVHFPALCIPSIPNHQVTECFVGWMEIATRDFG